MQIFQGTETPKTRVAIINVFKGNEQLTTMNPERRLYKASSQPQTIPRIYPTFKQDLFLVSDLYVVYEGRNDETGRPIIKAHLNPMVPWIWTGLIIMIFGTITCLIPNATPCALRFRHAYKLPRQWERAADATSQEIFCQAMLVRESFLRGNGNMGNSVRFTNDSRLGM